jgi:hypothetical protein
MRLSEHPDFRQAIVQAGEHLAARGLRPALIEKDYYVTEVLRVIATTVGVRVIFKGGTSLSKGWNLIQRFSEDVDSSSTRVPSIRCSAGTASIEGSRPCVMPFPAPWRERARAASSRLLASGARGRPRRERSSPRAG